MSTVSAVVVRDGAVLLVSGADPTTGERGWFLPGGKVEAGELPHEALRRELAEETGLAAGGLGRLAWVGTATGYTDGTAVEHVFFVFAVPDPGGLPAPADPDGTVDIAEFVPIPDAVKRLSNIPWPRMREPVVAYLTGAAPVGTTWVYRLGGTSEDDECAVTLPTLET